MAFVDNPIESRSQCSCEGSFSTSFSFLDSFWKGGEKKKKPSIQGEKGISSQHQLMKRLTWAPSTPPPIKSKWFVFNGLLHWQVGYHSRPRELSGSRGKSSVDNAQCFQLGAEAAPGALTIPQPPPRPLRRWLFRLPSSSAANYWHKTEAPRCLLTTPGPGPVGFNEVMEVFAALSLNSFLVWQLLECWPYKRFSVSHYFLSSFTSDSFTEIICISMCARARFLSVRGCSARRASVCTPYLSPYCVFYSLLPPWKNLQTWQCCFGGKKTNRRGLQRPGIC